MLSLLFPEQITPDQQYWSNLKVTLKIWDLTRESILNAQQSSQVLALQRQVFRVLSQENDELVAWLISWETD